MRSHIQGVFLLLVIGIVLLATARIAAPVVKEAFGEDGAIVAESSDVEDVVDLSVAEIIEDEGLTGDEVGLLQLYLGDLGFDPGPVDGLMGGNTRTAIEAAIDEYGLLAGSSDRAVFAFIGSLVGALTAAEGGTDAADTEGIPGAADLVPGVDEAPANG